MIIGKYFDGDNDEEFKLQQHKVYYETLRRWTIIADELSKQFTGVSAEWDKLIDSWHKNVMESCKFDHRCIQAPHDLIAARFRKDMLIELQTAGKLRKTDAWRSFFSKEAAICLRSEETLRLFMTTLAFSCCETGYDAEDKFCKKMIQKYDDICQNFAEL